MGYLSLALLGPVLLVLTCRFDPAVVAEVVAEHRELHRRVDRVRSEQLQSLRTVHSGGAPIVRSTVEYSRERFGQYIHNVYGLAETTSAVLAVPRTREVAVVGDPGSYVRRARREQ